MLRPDDAPYRTRLFVLFASAAPKAIILRRGPKRSWRLISWDLRTDRFERGQWMTGIVQLRDLSPDGSKLIYWAAQHHRRYWEQRHGSDRPYDALTAGYGKAARDHMRRRGKVPRYVREMAKTAHRSPRANTGTWTAISSPPYFSALAIWPSHGTWTGGGVFRSSREAIIFERDDGIGAIENSPIPASFTITPFEHAHALRVSLDRSAIVPMSLQSGNGLHIATALLESGCRHVDWISDHDRPDLLFAADGCIFRLRDWQRMSAAEYLRGSDLLIDVRDDAFTNISAPVSVMKW